MSSGTSRPISIGIIGGGVLGKAIARGFVEHAEVRLYDIVPEKATHCLEDAATADIVFIALPTPANPDGTCDTSLIEQFLDKAYGNLWWKTNSCYVIRSTVPLGFTQRQAEKHKFTLPLLHSPEFLTARCALTDFQTPSRNIIGVPLPKEAWFDRATRTYLDDEQVPCFDKEYVGRISSLYGRRFPGVPILIMPSNASELVKLACNTFFGVKVQTFTLFFQVAKAAGLNWEDVRNGILSDGRIAHAHTMVPGPDGLIGSGGTCIPKDSADLFRCAEELGLDAGFVREVIERNERLRGPLDSALVRLDLSHKPAK